MKLSKSQIKKLDKLSKKKPIMVRVGHNWYNWYESEGNIVWLTTQSGDEKEFKYKEIDDIQEGIIPQLREMIRKEITEDIGIETYLGGIVKALSRAGIKPKTAKVMKHGFSKSKDKIGFFIDVLDRKREKYTLQLEVDRDGNLWYLSASKDMKLGKWADTSKIVRSLKAISKLPDFGQSSLKRR